MGYVSWIIWSICLFIALLQLFLLNSKDGGVKRIAFSFFLFLALGLLATTFGSISKFHLLWWLPVAYFASTFIFQWRVKRNSDAYFKEGNQIQKVPMVGVDLSWIQIYRQVLRIIEFDRSGTTIDEKGNVKAVSMLNPYGYLHVISPIFDSPFKVPITHKTDFLLASSIFDDAELGNKIESYEVLVTYFPENVKKDGKSLSLQHQFHFIITHLGVLNEFYLSDSGNNKTNPSPEKIFDSFVWDGELSIAFKTNFDF